MADNQQVLARFGAYVLFTMLAQQINSATRGEVLDTISNVPSGIPSTNVLPSFDESQDCPDSSEGDGPCTTVLNMPVTMINQPREILRQPADTGVTLLYPLEQFTHRDLFRSDVHRILLESYPQWSRYGFWGETFHPGQMRITSLQGLALSTGLLNQLEDEKRPVEDILRKVSYLVQRRYFQELIDNNVPDPTGTFLRYFHKDWTTTSEEEQKQRIIRFQKQTALGRHWSSATKKLSYGAVLLCGNRLSTIIHKKHPIVYLDPFLFNIAERYPEAIEIYKMLDKAVRDLICWPFKLPDLDIAWIVDQLDSYCQEMNHLYPQIDSRRRRTSKRNNRKRKRA